MLEKARLKSKKGQSNNNSLQAGSGGAGGNDEDLDDDGLCCTCGQKVGQHNHVPVVKDGGSGQGQKALEGAHGGRGK